MSKVLKTVRKKLEAVLGPEQMEVVNDTSPRVWIKGGGGTGKTWVLIAKAVRLKLENPEADILILAKNNSNIENTKNLFDYFAGNKPETKERKDSFEGISVFTVDTRRKLYNEGDKSKFHHILIDEVFDFNDEQISFLKEIMSDNATVTVAYDGIQKTRKEHKAPELKILSEMRRWKRFALRRQYRCSPKILEYAGSYFNETLNKEAFKDAYAKPEGDFADYIPEVDFENEGDQMAFLVEHLKKEKKKSDKSIGIILGCSMKYLYPFRDKMEEGGLEEDVDFFVLPRPKSGDDDWNYEDKKIFLVTVHSAKGLEFDRVIIPSYHDYTYENQLFTALTRAKRELAVLKINGEEGLKRNK